MKKLRTFLRKRNFFCNCMLFALAAMAFLITGCPQNDYTVQLKPQGNVIERTLLFYCADGMNTNNGVPNYQAFDTNELTGIVAFYPTNALTKEGGRYFVKGEFTNKLPDDVGGAGVYTCLTNSLGAAGFYVERFRGNDDLAGMTERRFKAAGQLTDLMIGWSQIELSREPGYEQLRQFLDVNVRRDLKNLSSYWWEGELASSYKTNASEEFMVRFGQYLFERGYFTLGEIPNLLSDDGNLQAMMIRRIQRLVARKMGVPDTEPVPASLAFLADGTKMEKSFTNFLAGTDAYRIKLKQWEEDKKLKPDAKQPEPPDVLNDVIGNLVNFDLFGGKTDHLTVRLSLPSEPVHTNGRWDEVTKQVVWDTDIQSRTNTACLPFSCYASWVKADDEFQKKHFGKVVLTGDGLTQYCLWRSGQDLQQGDEWDAFLISLQPGTGLTEKIDAFRFSGDVDSIYPRELLKSALR